MKKHNFCDETILIVDDEEDIREILQEYFERSGAKVITAENGRDAFQLLNSCYVDVIISDMQMPEMDGEELLKCIRATNTNIARKPFFFISGNATFTKQAAEEIGARGSFQKPFKFDEIDKLVGEALGVSVLE